MLIVLGILCIPVLAQEDAVYNLGTMQADRNIMIGPGETGDAKLYFFNIHGNRITHIRLYVKEAPEGWDIKINPEVHTEQFIVSGLTVNSTENLYVEPSASTPDIPEDKSEGLEYIRMEGVEGYIPAKVVKITINVPEEEEAGKTFRLEVEAIANWFGQKGMVTFSQSRTFDYYITTISKEYSEEVIQEKTKRTVSEKGNLFGELPETYIVIGILILIVLFQLILYIRKR